MAQATSCITPADLAAWSDDVEVSIRILNKAASVDRHAFSFEALPLER